MLRRSATRFATLFGAAAVLAGCGAGSAAATTAGVAAATKTLAVPPPAALAYQQAIISVVKEIEPSVVQISTAQGLGSGIVFDRKGDIVTNAHVVGTATSFTVTTYGGKTFRNATLVGAFAPDDLAVIHVSGAALKPATFANSSKLQVGQIAIAIGNPLGLQSSVTNGIVSALNRPVQEPTGYTLPQTIQTSAPINPGNSGGALVDIYGRVIGIPTLAATDPQLGGSAAPGIGFAIPSNVVKDIAGQIVAHGHVVDSHRAYLGIAIGDTGGNGVYVGTVETGGPAAKAGLQVGDVIVSVNGKPTPTTSALSEVVITLKPGQTVSVVVQRQGVGRKTLRLTIGSWPGG